MKYFVKGTSGEHLIELNGSPEKTQLVGAKGTQDVELVPLGKQHLYSLLLDGKSCQLYMRRKDDGGYLVVVNGSKYELEVENEKSRFLKSLIKAETDQRGEAQIKAPMPGLIVSVNVAEGHAVKKGETLLIIEAMKMENEIRASVSGTVKQILKNSGESIDKDTLLLVIEQS